MPRRRSIRVEPPLLAYSFEECPETKLSSCCQYEYLASSQLFRQTVERWRTGQGDPLTKAVVLFFGPDIYRALIEGWWPLRPYLDCREVEPQPHVQSKLRQRDLADLVRPWTHLYDAANVVRVVPVYIFPGLTLPQLKKGFGDLLLRDYPELLEKPAKAESSTQKRGLGSRIQQARTDLKALSAWRLQKQFGYTVKAAIALSRNHKLSTYQDERGFRRAVKKAAQKIAAFEEQLRQSAKNMTA